MAESEWKEIALKARDKIMKMEQFIQKVTTPPFVYGTVISRGDDSADVQVDGRKMEVSYVDDVREKLIPGAVVRLNPESMAVVGMRDASQTGLFSTVAEVLPDGIVVVEEGGAKHILKASTEAKAGDRIMIDQGFNVVLQNFGKQSSKYSVPEVPVVPWSRIGGLEQTIETIKETIEEPFIHREVYARYGKKAPKGVLLYGPPGCGKTLLAKAIAYNLGERMKQEGKSKGNGYFLSVKGPELLNMFVGNSEQSIRELFRRARDSSANRGDVTVLFMDEAESLLQKRGTGISSDVMNTIVPQFLSEMDGIEENSDLVLVLATNRPDTMDPAVLRPGRIDKRIRIPRPTEYASKEIFNVHLGNMPLHESETRTGLAGYATAELFDPRYPLFHVTFDDATKGAISLGDLTSGAMIESIAQRAAGMAIKREIGRGRKGISKKDIAAAVSQEYHETRELASFDRDDMMTIFPEKYRAVVNVDRAYGGKNGD